MNESVIELAQRNISLTTKAKSMGRDLQLAIRFLEYVVAEAGEVSEELVDEISTFLADLYARGKKGPHRPADRV